MRNEEICIRIRLLREQSGLTQQEFAQRVGVTKGMVNNWENYNKVPSHESLLKIAQRYGVTMDWLYGLEAAETLSLKGMSNREIQMMRDLQLLILDLHSE